MKKIFTLILLLFLSFFICCNYKEIETKENSKKQTIDNIESHESTKENSSKNTEETIENTKTENIEKTETVIIEPHLIIEPNENNTVNILVNGINNYNKCTCSYNNIMCEIDIAKLLSLNCFNKLINISFKEYKEDTLSLYSLLYTLKFENNNDSFKLNFYNNSDCIIILLTFSNKTFEYYLIGNDDMFLNELNKYIEDCVSNVQKIEVPSINLTLINEIKINYLKTFHNDDKYITVNDYKKTELVNYYGLFNGYHILCIDDDFNYINYVNCSNDFLLYSDIMPNKKLLLVLAYKDKEFYTFQSLKENKIFSEEELLNIINNYTPNTIFNYNIINDIKDDEYCIEIYDDYNYVLNALDLYSKTYKAGDVVTVYCRFLSGPKGGLSVDGVEIENKLSDTTTGISPVAYTFIMPDHDVVLRSILNDIPSNFFFQINDIPASPTGINIDNISRIYLASGPLRDDNIAIELTNYSNILNALDKTYEEVESMPKEHLSSLYYLILFKDNYSMEFNVYDDHIYIKISNKPISFDSVSFRYFKSKEEVKNSYYLDEIIEDIKNISNISNNIVNITIYDKYLVQTCSSYFPNPPIFSMIYNINDAEVIKQFVEEIKNAQYHVDFNFTNINLKAYTIKFEDENGVINTVDIPLSTFKNYCIYNLEFDFNKYLLDNYKYTFPKYNGTRIVDNSLIISIKEEYKDKIFTKEDFEGIEFEEFEYFDSINVFLVKLKGYNEYMIAEAIDLLTSKFDFIESISPNYVVYLC